MGWSDYLVGGLFLIATVFAAIAIGVSWGSVGDPDFFEVRYGAFSADIIADGDVQDGNPYKMADLDEADGIGLVRAGGPMLVTGLVLVAVATLAYEHRIVMDKQVFATVGVAAGALGFIFWVVGMSLLPAGLAKLSDNGFGDDISWGAGLAMAIIAGVLQLAAVGVGVVRMLMTTGFRFEVADSGPANFD